MIGRQKEALNEIRPNDIVQSQNDMAVSRIHCAIMYKYIFDDLRSIPRSYQVFLSGKQKKNQSSHVTKLSNYILRKIYDFIKPEKKLWALDLGSYVGTFKRLKNGEEKEVKIGQAYLVGSDSKFIINMACATY